MSFPDKKAEHELKRANYYLEKWVEISKDPTWVAFWESYYKQGHPGRFTVGPATTMHCDPKSNKDMMKRSFRIFRDRNRN